MHASYLLDVCFIV